MKELVIKLFLLLIFTTVFGTITIAQVSRVLMPFANPLYLNPAYAGSTPNTRFVGHFHYEDSHIVNFPYSSYSASLDKLIGKSSGLGLQYFKNVNYKIESLDVVYTYNFKINDRLSLRPAISIGIERNTRWAVGYYLDTRIGFMAVYDNLNIGFSIDHLSNQLHENSIDHPINVLDSPQYFFHTKYDFCFDDQNSLTAAILYATTPKSNRSQTYYPSLIYRHKYINTGLALYLNANGVYSYIGMLGYINDRMIITYSFGYINNTYTHERVAHELALALKIIRKKTETKN
jgi:hypothetical protein